MDVNEAGGLYDHGGRGGLYGHGGHGNLCDDGGLCYNGDHGDHDDEDGDDDDAHDILFCNNVLDKIFGRANSNSHSANGHHNNIFPCRNNKVFHHNTEVYQRLFLDEEEPPLLQLCQR